MEQYFPFQLPSLPYSYVAMMPHCDANTLYYHHDGYNSDSVYELNRLVVRHRLTDRSLKQLVTEDFNLPAAQLEQLKSAAGSVYNHQMFFEGMNCKAGQPPVNQLTEEIISRYGSMAQFQQRLTEAAQGIIGSGWVWLIAEGGHGIHIATTENNQVVALDSVTPVLILDMWEHAYFPIQHFDKGAYVDAWFSLINWNVAEEKYLSALSAKSVG